MSVFRVILFLLMATAISPLVLAMPAAAGNIYIADTVGRLNLEGTQRAKVRQITRETEKKLLEVLRKYKLKPDARPDFDRLVEASGELKSLQRNERKQLSVILTKDQMKHYDDIINEVAIRVRKAAK